MVKLFRYEGFRVVIAEEALTLKPFRLIWNRDRSSSKGKAINELSYIYFLCDPRSDYQYIVDKEERGEAIKEGIGLDKDWSPDKVVQEAILFYESFKPTSALLLEDTKIAIDKVRDYLRNIDLYALDDKGKPIHTLNTVTATIKAIPSLVKDLNEAEASLKKEIVENSRIRGNKDKSLMDDMLDF